MDVGNHVQATVAAGLDFPDTIPAAGLSPVVAVPLIFPVVDAVLDLPFAFLPSISYPLAAAATAAVTFTIFLARGRFASPSPQA